MKKHYIFGLIFIAISFVSLFAFVQASSEIKISHPSPGAKLILNNSFDLQFCTDYSLESLPAGYNKIYLLTETGFKLGLIGDRYLGATPCAGGASIFSWNVGSFADGTANLSVTGNYQISIEYYSNNGQLIESGKSSLFNIGRGIEVIAPNGGETWILGESKLIIWASHDSTITNYDLQLWSLDMTKKWSIGSTGNNTGIPWTVGEVQCLGAVGSCNAIIAGSYYIRISAHRASDPEASYPVYAYSLAPFMISNQNSISTPTPNITPVVCAQDAKLCADGSYVSRVTPNCAFAECTTTQTPPSLPKIVINPNLQDLLDQIKALQTQIILLQSKTGPKIPIDTDNNGTKNTPTDMCLVLSNNLAYRSRDALTERHVGKLQDFLRSKNYLNSGSTGFFGALTFIAIKRFQNDNGINATGFVGPLTRAKIKALSCNQQ